MSKVITRLYSSIINLAKILFFLLVLTTIFLLGFSDRIEYHNHRQLLLPNFVILALALCCGYLIANKTLSDSSVRFNKKRANFFVILSTFLVCFTVFLFGYRNLFLGAWDSGGLFTAAWRLSTGLSTTPGAPAGWDSYFTFNWVSDYLSTYPNNLVFLSFEKGVMDLLNSFGYLTVRHALISLLFINSLLTFSSILTLYFVFLRETNCKAAVIGWFFALLLIGFSFWVFVPYTDVLALFLLSTLLNFFSLMDKAEGNKIYSLFLGFLVGFLGFVGFKIKPQIIFILIGAFLFYLYRICKNRQVKDDLNSIFHLLGSLLFGSLVAFYFIAQLINPIKAEVHFDESKSFSYYHYLMMGANDTSDGSFLSDDVLFSQSFSDSSVRNQNNLNKFRDRVSNSGFWGFMLHLAKKQLVNWSDAEFGWECEGGFYSYALSNPLNVANVFSSPIGQLFQLIKQFIWFLLLSLIIFGLAKSLNFNGLSFICAASIFCLMIFELLFEARARYIYAYVPVVLMFVMIHLYSLTSDKAAVSDDY